MKKRFILIILLILIGLPVKAKISKFYFTESGKHIYYESDLLDEKTFLNHTDMVPGKQYKDKLIIENGTNTNYKIYFKVELQEQNQEKEELLNNINMRIILDNKEIYEGNATGINPIKNQDLRNAILLGDFSKGKTSEMIIETKLREEYDNTNNRELSMINWTFYAQYEEEPVIEIIEAPNTMKNQIPLATIISAVVVSLGLGIIGYAKKAKK